MSLAYSIPSPIPQGRMRALQVGRVAPDLAGVGLNEIAIPQPGLGEVLVRVCAAALGFPDYLMTFGGYQTKPEPPFLGGMEVSGEVVETGEGVVHVQPGDAVVAMGKGGGFAEYAVFSGDKVFHKPRSLSFVQAAALGTAYLTAYVALVRCARVEAGEWVLVHGAAGGVGLAAVGLAAALGAKPIAVISSAAKRDSVAQLHPQAQVIDGSAGFREAVKMKTDGGADVVFDPVGGRVFTESLRCLRFGGRLLIVGFASGAHESVPANLALIKGISVIGVRAGEYGRRFPQKGKENLDAVFALAEAGAITPHVHAALPLGSWREAFRLLINRDVVGRVVLVPEA